MTEPDPFVEQMWVKHRDRVLARLTALEESLDALARGEQVDRAAAAREAHVLAGGLGTYGRPGSELMSRVELALAVRDEAEWPALAGAVRDVVAQVRG